MNKNENFMGTMPVWKMIAKLSVPTVIITLVMAIYNMADVFFIGKTNNADMVNAISVCMPVFTIVQAFGTLVGAGGCTAISIALGKGETDRTKSISAFCFWFCMLLGVVLGTPRFCINSLLPQGLCILGGASKIGKSWLVLDWVDKVAKGESIWGMETKQGTTLYLCLEDSFQRVQHRLYCISEEATRNAYYATTAGTLADNLLDQITSFLLSHPDTVLIVVDTFQLVRENCNDPSYAGDYQEIRKLKQIADEYRITILLVHHVRKLNDPDPLNRLSGTTGLIGAAD